MIIQYATIGSYQLSDSLATTRASSKAKRKAPGHKAEGSVCEHHRETMRLGINLAGDAHVTIYIHKHHLLVLERCLPARFLS